MADGPKQTGKVKWFNTTKGFGFITPDDGSEDLFVHQTSIHSEGFRSLQDGEDVEFYVEQGDDGRTKAVDVTGPNGSAVRRVEVEMAMAEEEGEEGDEEVEEAIMEAVKVAAAIVEVDHVTNVASLVILHANAPPVAAGEAAAAVAPVEVAVAATTAGSLGISPVTAQ